MENNFSQRIEEYIISRVIFDEVSKELKSCLKKTNREILREYGNRYRLDKTEEKGSIKLSEELNERILEDLEKNLSYKDEAFIEKIYEDISREDLDIEEGIDDLMNFMEYNHYGWGFLFIEEDKEDFIPVIPKEIAKKLGEIEKDHVMNKSRRYKRISQVLKALIHLYGVLEEEQFLKVWEEIGEGELSAADFHKYLADHPEEGRSFRIFDGDILHGTFESPIEAATLKDRRKGKEYYIPSKAEIEIFENHYSDPKTKEYKDVYAFLEKHSTAVQADRAMAQLEFFSASSAKKDLDTILSILADSGIIIEKQDLTKLGDRMTEFLNHSPIWENKGNTPQSLYDKTVEDIKDKGNGNIIHKNIIQ